MGEWHAFRDNECGPGWDWCVARPGGHENIVGLESKETARVIAAAPAMLQALKDFDHLSFVIESAVRNLGQPHTADSVVHVIKAARAAIAKAAPAPERQG